MEFKEAAIKIVGNHTNPREECLEGAAAANPEKVLKTAEAVTQNAQNSQGDQIQRLTKQMEELTMGMAKIHKEMSNMIGQTEPVSESPGWRTEPRRPYRDRWKPPENYDRRSPDRFDSRRRPICRYCHRMGHMEKDCYRKNLNDYALGKRADPRGDHRE